MKKPNPTALQTAITAAARQTFAEVQAAHPGETFYAYSLYTDEAASYIGASANTEEGLIRRAKHYEAKEKKGLQEHARSLRWHSPDWAYHCIGEDHFEHAQKLLDAWWKSGGKDIDEYEKQVAAGLDLFVAALKTLDEEGFFGRGAARQQVTLLVTMGDQETKLLLKCAQQLNPPKVFKAFSQPFLRPTTGKLKGIGSKKVYETTSVAISRNGKVLACAGSSSSSWPCLFAFALPARKEILRLTLNETIELKGLAVSPDGTALFAGWASLEDDANAGIRCWDVRTKKIKWNMKCAEGAWCLDLSPDGALIATGSENGLVCLRDAGSGKLIRKMAGHKDCVECVRFAPSGRVLASSDRAKSLRLWAPDSGKELAKIADAGNRLAFSPDGKLLAMASNHVKGKNLVSLWDVTRRKLTAKLDAVAKSRFQVIQGPDDYEDCQASGVAFSPDGRFLAVERSWPGSVVLWDWKKSKELIWMNPDYECLDGVVFLPDGKTVAVAGRSMDGPPLLLWDISEAAKGK